MTTSDAARAPRRPRGRVVVAVIFVLLAINALAQVAMRLAGGNADPTLLSLLQLLIGVTALTAAWGSWRGARWSPMAAALYGVVTGGMLASLPSMLDLPPEARGGIMAGAITVLVVAFVLAWYLRRTLAPRAPAPPR